MECVFQLFQMSARQNQKAVELLELDVSRMSDDKWAQRTSNGVPLNVRHHRGRPKRRCRDELYYYHGDWPTLVINKITWKRWRRPLPCSREKNKLARLNLLCFEKSSSSSILPSSNSIISLLVKWKKERNRKKYFLLYVATSKLLVLGSFIWQRYRPPISPPDNWYFTRSPWKPLGYCLTPHTVIAPFKSPHRKSKTFVCLRIMKFKT